MTDLIAILLGVVLVNRFVLGQFPRLWTLPAADGSPVVTAGLSLGTIVSLALASPGVWLLQTRGLAAIGVPQLSLIGWVLAVAVAVRAIWLLMSQVSPQWHGLLEPFRSLVTFNATAIGVGLGATRTASGLMDAALTGALAAALFCGLLLLFGSTCRRLESGDVPELLRGTAIGLVTAAIISLAFAGLEGIWRG